MRGPVLPHAQTSTVIWSKTTWRAKPALMQRPGRPTTVGPCRWWRSSHESGFKGRTAMISKKFSFDIVRFSLVLVTMLGASYAAGQSEATPPAGSPQPAAFDVRGTWSGTFFSKHSNV